MRSVAWLRRVALPGGLLSGRGPDAAAGLFGVAVALLRANPYGFLITADGGIHSRLVEHLRVDDDATVWIGTSPRSRKAADVSGGEMACYSVEDRAAFGYVTVTARPVLSADLAQRRALWQDELAAFFPGGPEGDDFVLLRLSPVRIELMNFARAVHPDPYGLVPAVIERDETGWRAAPPFRRA
jgi:general stress protein 26